MIKQIESFRPQLQIESLDYLRRLQHRRVEVREARAIQNVSTRIPKASKRRKRKRRCVEPAVWRTTRKLRAADDVRTIIGAKPKRRPAGVAVVDVRKQRNRERPPALQGDYPKGLPAREKRGQQSTIRNKGPAFPTGKIVTVAQRQAMPHVEIRAAPLAGSVEAILGKVRIARARKETRRVVDRF